MIHDRTECSWHTEESHFVHRSVYPELLSFRGQKKQYDFFGFGEEIGLEFFAGDNIFDKTCKDKRSAYFFFEIKLNLCVFKKIMFKFQSILSYEKSFYYKRKNL